MPKIPFYMTYPMQNLYETELLYERDMKRMKELYPKEVKKILICVEDQCDELEYPGSMMYDESPDRLMIEKIVDKIYRRLQQEMPENMRMQPDDDRMPGRQVTPDDDRMPGRQVMPDDSRMPGRQVMPDDSRMPGNQVVPDDMRRQPESSGDGMKRLPESGIDREQSPVNMPNGIDREQSPMNTQNGIGVLQASALRMQQAACDWFALPEEFFASATGKDSMAADGMEIKSVESVDKIQSESAETVDVETEMAEKTVEAAAWQQRPGGPGMPPPPSGRPGMPPGPGMPPHRKDPLWWLTGVLFNDEMYRRRCRNRRCRRWW